MNRELWRITVTMDTVVSGTREEAEAAIQSHIVYGFVHNQAELGPRGQVLPFEFRDAAVTATREEEWPRV